ncbi:efflux RND transporter periplasmic adaptor subunit [Undibacterium luofuense]|uniref:efflux RND transporter periplasmic adaptor subunit n=1 Tax=Undibacterium luofuense TaxID=2828733 RepID=UPI0030EF2560
MQIFTKKRVIVAAVLLALGGGAVVMMKSSPDKAKEQLPRYRTAVVDTGNLTQTVTASGTLNPVALVNVGSQVSGQVSELNADFNDRVKKGQVLLKLDPTIFNAQVKQAEASLASAEANRRLAQANLERNQRLQAQNFVSGSAMDQSKRELEVADANIKVARAQLDNAVANLNNSVIRSPIDGVIIKRTIDIGQTVAAAFQTPNLFQIARDLTKMQIDTNVSEADVGALRDGLPARFVVDAYPDREFEATLRQFRLAANVQQNVVTYNVVLDVDNKDELLKPGMTAQVRVVVGQRQNVLRIPTAALRFKLSDEEQAKENKRKEASASASASAVAAAASASKTAASDADDDIGFRSRRDQTRTFKVYKLDDKNQAVPVDIQIGLSNFRFTEVLKGDLKAGEKVIIRSAAKNGENG